MSDCQFQVVGYISTPKPKPNQQLVLTAKCTCGGVHRGVTDEIDYAWDRGTLGLTDLCEIALNSHQVLAASCSKRSRCPERGSRFCLSAFHLL